MESKVGWPEGVGVASTEVHFTQEQESEVAQIARRDGKAGAGEMLREAGLEMLDQEARGEFIEGAEMDSRFEQMLRD